MLFFQFRELPLLFPFVLSSDPVKTFSSLVRSPVFRLLAATEIISQAVKILQVFLLCCSLPTLMEMGTQVLVWNPNENMATVARQTVATGTRSIIYSSLFLIVHNQISSVLYL